MGTVSESKRSHVSPASVPKRLSFVPRASAHWFKWPLISDLAVAIENRHDTLHIRAFAPKVPGRIYKLVWRRRSALELALRPVGETLRSACVKSGALVAIR